MAKERNLSLHGKQVCRSMEEGRMLEERCDAVIVRKKRKENDVPEKQRREANKEDA